MGPPTEMPGVVVGPPAEGVRGEVGPPAAEPGENIAKLYTETKNIRKLPIHRHRAAG